MSPGRVAYRVRQFATAFIVQWRAQEKAEVVGILSPGELALFYGMRRAALRHSLQVYRHLRRRGIQDRDLLAAALLHDVGKGQVTLAHRVAAVLLKATLPGWLDRLAGPAGPRWKRAFYFHRHHAKLGAELVERAGSQPRVVALVENHHRPGLEDPPGLAALREADEDS